MGDPPPTPTPTMTRTPSPQANTNTSILLACRQVSLLSSIPEACADERRPPSTDSRFLHGFSTMQLATLYPRPKCSGAKTRRLHQLSSAFHEFSTAPLEPPWLHPSFCGMKKHINEFSQVVLGGKTHVASLKFGFGLKQTSPTLRFGIRGRKV